jgi:hypothetical protein
MVPAIFLLAYRHHVLAPAKAGHDESDEIQRNEIGGSWHIPYQLVINQNWVNSRPDGNCRE